jgi:Flp pilus assembly protein TadD
MLLETGCSRQMVRVLLAVTLTLAFIATATAEDKSLRVTLPKRSKPTPVQKLNREGVNAIEKHQYDKARKLFFQAYLLDPNDPFTLNNLGYISELEGEVDRAARYYDLAQQQNSDAVVDLATSTAAEGKPVSKVAGNAAELGMAVNRINVSAINLLLKNRASEADLLLQKGLELDAHNPFTINNMGFAKEKQGELESALSYYNAAAAVGSHEPVVVTVNKSWRGRPITEVAEENAVKLRKEMVKELTPSAHVARLNLEGVSAMNRNDRGVARKYFQEAFKLDPRDAFTLNNMGFLAELDGDRETANFYYEKAQEAKHRQATVTVATRVDAQGKKVEQVAGMSDQAVAERMKATQELKRREGGPIELRRRDAPSPSEKPEAGSQNKDQE